MSDVAISELLEAGEDGGELMGYYSRGHVSAHEFAAAANAYTGADPLWDRRHVRAEEVRQVWWRTVPVAGQPGCSAFHPTCAGARGAWKATVWDELSARPYRRAKQAVEEVRRARGEGQDSGVRWADAWLRDHGHVELASALTIEWHQQVPF